MTKNAKSFLDFNFYKLCAIFILLAPRNISHLFPTSNMYHLPKHIEICLPEKTEPSNQFHTALNYWHLHNRTKRATMKYFKIGQSFLGFVSSTGDFSPCDLLILRTIDLENFSIKYFFHIKLIFNTFSNRAIIGHMNDISRLSSNYQNNFFVYTLYIMSIDISIPYV